VGIIRLPFMPYQRYRHALGFEGCISVRLPVMPVMPMMAVGLFITEYYAHLYSTRTVSHLFIVQSYHSLQSEKYSSYDVGRMGMGHTLRLRSGARRQRRLPLALRYW